MLQIHLSHTINNQPKTKNIRQKKPRRELNNEPKLEQREVCASAMMQQQKLNNYAEIHELYVLYGWLLVAEL